MGIFLAFFVVVSLVCLILLVKIKLKQRRSQVMAPEWPVSFIPEAPLPVQARAGSWTCGATLVPPHCPVKCALLPSPV